MIDVDCHALLLAGVCVECDISGAVCGEHVDHPGRGTAQAAQHEDRTETAETHGDHADQQVQVQQQQQGAQDVRGELVSTHSCLETSLTLPMLGQISSDSQGRKDFLKPYKPCHVGIHQKAPTKNSQMSTHVPGFQSLFRIFASFCIGQISRQQHKG